jgi:hypothetical protein
VSSDPRSESNPIEVSNAWRRSVVYANPRNDLTQEVIRALNGKSGADEPERSR